MWKSKEKAPIKEFLLWVILISIFSEGICMLLERFSLQYAEEGVITFGYIAYALVGILFSTPGPMIAMYIVLKRKEKCSIKEFMKRIVATDNVAKSMVVLSMFCIPALLLAVFCGTATGAPWYLMVLALPLMIIGGGVEEVGWRGFLQPEMERRLSYPFATIVVAIIWDLWHLPLWIMPSSNHYGDSFIGFSINIFVWSFALAAIYKATKSVLTCVLYHAFINSIGAIYDWNSLFDAFPGTVWINLYRIIILLVSILLWRWSDRKEKAKE
ncbi:MAG: CPBP family intramembrane metalloprotease [Lachnospiraceae bacterium]|nr:CPBP family intramembrane metalloprotease [Lachnospiraceae bacterium]